MKKTNTYILSPLRDQHAVLLGQTGTGKTTLGEVLCSRASYVAVLDIKDELFFPGYFRSYDFKEITKLDPEKYPKVIYAPTADELLNEEAIDKFFRWTYDRENTLVYCDEVYGATEHGLTIGHNRVLTRGRSRNVAIINGSQRPHLIPRNILTEAKNWYVFYLGDILDRVAVENFSGISREQIAALKPREFLFRRQGELVKGPFRLKFEAKNGREKSAVSV